MFATQTKLTNKISLIIPKKVAFNIHNKKESITLRDTEKFALKPSNTLLQISPFSSVKKITIPIKKKKKIEVDPMLLYSPLMCGTPPPKVFKKFLDGEVDQCQILKHQLTQRDQTQQTEVKKRSLLRRGKTIYMKNKNEGEEHRPSKLTVLQKFIQTKILKRKMKKSIQFSKRSEIINVIQEQRPINLSNSIKKLKQMQILYIPKSPIEQDEETINYQKLRFFNESDEYLRQLENQKVEEQLGKIEKSGKRLVRQLKIKNTKQKKNADYYPMEQEVFTQKDVVLYNYLREQNCIRKSSFFSHKQGIYKEISSSQSSRKSISPRAKQYRPLVQQVLKTTDSSDEECASADLSLQSVYEYFLDDLYNEQKKLEQKLNFQQALNMKLDKQMKTVKKMKEIHQRVIDCSLQKLLAQ